mmetsp:Transcript_27520/g.80684  ORF Transcript_27520/g.80684 Transcript_27520/m.80684 type:complete len:236 (-) Transcript_27520:1135-1842(-)
MARAARASRGEQMALGGRADIGRQRRGQRAAGGALSCEVHRDGELVGVERAVAVDVGEVPHLPQHVDRQLRPLKDRPHLQRLPRSLGAGGCSGGRRGEGGGWLRAPSARSPCRRPERACRRPRRTAPCPRETRSTRRRAGARRRTGCCPPAPRSPAAAAAAAAAAAVAAARMRSAAAAASSIARAPRRGSARSRPRSWSARQCPPAGTAPSAWGSRARGRAPSPRLPLCRALGTW